MWYSQAGQDEWVHSLFGDTGYFVDVGAYDGISTSNTYALELLGWDGLCIEPGPSFSQLRTNRNCDVAHQAASDKIGGLYFDGNQVTPTGTYVPASTLDYLLTAASAPEHIDYLSIDVEGHELQVLHGIDFARWHVEAITIEHNAYRDGPDLKDDIHNHLTRNGFVRVFNDVGCIDPCPPPAYVGCPFEDWYLRR